MREDATMVVYGFDDMLNSQPLVYLPYKKTAT
jgi:hypothetical protein